MTSEDEPCAGRSNNPTLESLPDDVLLRIISLTGGPGAQVGAAYRLGALSTRFRRLLKEQFLTSITKLSNDCISSLSLADPLAARQALASMFASTPAVKELDIGACSPTLLSEQAIQALASAARESLTKVNFAYCRVTDVVVKPLLSCPKLKSLSLYSCNGVNGMMFGEGEVCAPLEFLDLSWVHSLSRDGVRAIAGLSTLKHLVLKGCDAVNRSTLRAFTTAQVRTSLNSICLSYCQLRMSALIELLRTTPNLRRLTLAEQNGNLWSTGYFTVEDIEELRMRFPNVDIRYTT